MSKEITGPHRILTNNTASSPVNVHVGAPGLQAPDAVGGSEHEPLLKWWPILAFALGGALSAGALYERVETTRLELSDVQTDVKTLNDRVATLDAKVSTILGIVQGRGK